MNDSLYFKQPIPMEKPIPVQDYPLRLHLSDGDIEHPVFVPPHWHEHMELLYFYEGKTKVVIGGDTILAKEGDLVVINGNEVHSTERLENSAFYCLRIAPSFFSDIDFTNVFFNHTF